jgi:NADH pyrophosphatase NudC (nudix superfamily)
MADTADLIQVFGSRDMAWEKRRRVLFCERCGSPCEPRVIWGSPLEKDVCSSCGNVHFVDPTPAVAVVVVQDGRVLLCKRAARLGFAGLWNLPSGHIDVNEDFISASLRETEHESGIRVEIKGVLGVLSSFWEFGGSQLCIALLAENLGGEPGPTELADEVGWFSPDALPELAWESHRHIIQQHFADRGRLLPVDLHFARSGAAADWEPPPSTRHSI